MHEVENVITLEFRKEIRYLLKQIFIKTDI